MSTRTGTVMVPGGRQLSFEVGGDPLGYPVIGLHGTPGCRLSRWPADSAYADAGVKYVTTDRAGYGQSTRRRGRSVADEVHDVLAVADALGFGWADDTLAFAAPWGFEPRRITIPVLTAYGRADVNVPPSHGDWLAA